MSLTIEDIFGNITDSAFSPEIAVKILRMFEENENLSSYELSKTISYDPQLTAYILKIANSAYYNMSKRVKVLPDAVTIMGVDEIKKIVIMNSAKSVFGNNDIYDKLLWRHSLGVAVAASELNSIIKLTGESLAYTMGLLHDIGKPIMKSVKQLNYLSLIKNSYENNLTYFKEELKFYGYTHADVGSRLLEKWNINQEIVDAVAFHHINFSKNRKSFLNNAALVNIADYFVNAMGIGTKEPTTNLQEVNNLPSASLLGFYANDPDVLAAKIYKKILLLEQEI